jgi:acetolactate synthase I/II/III large subunit
MPKITGAQFIAETFKGYGITHVFFVPAVLWGALAEMKKLGIHRIGTHSEKAAAYMADGYARASHAPGICMAQSVGAANLAAGLQDAYLGLSPVIAITGVRPSMQKYRNPYQEIEHTPLFNPVTKFNVAVDTMEQLPLLLRQAFREATSGAPGPVHLDFPGTQGEVIGEGTGNLEVIIEEQFTHYPPFRPEPETGLVREALSLIEKSERPVIVAGGGVTASRAQKEVVEFAEKLSIPVGTSLNGKGTILDNHPLAVGVVGSYSRWCANRVVSEADLVIFIGSHTGSQVTNDWRIPRPGTLVIQIDIDASELGRNYPSKLALMGDAKATMRCLIEMANPVKRSGHWLRRVEELVSEWRAETAKMRDSDTSPIRPERICKELSGFLPSDALVISDTGHSGIWTGSMLDLKYPEQSYIRCAGSLGWGFPGSLGAKCAVPERPVICFTGDGGFWYHVAELETAVRCDIRTITVVNNNHSLNQAKNGAEQAHTNHPHDSDEVWKFSDVSFAQIARDMGCLGIRVTKPGEIKPALEQALESEKPALVEVVSDIEAIAPPAWS